MPKKSKPKKAKTPKPLTSNQIRYNLHHQIKLQGYKIAPKKRTIYVPFNYDESTLSKEVQRLRTEFHYALQTEIPQEKQPDPFTTK